MISRRNVPKGYCTDELGDLIWKALYSSADHVQPPAYMWERIEQEVQRRTVARAWRYTLAGLWEAFKWNIQHWMIGQAGWNRGCDGLCQPMIFSGWKDRIPLSLVYIIEQPMPILRGMGWAT